MNVSDTITEMLEKGSGPVFFGKPPANAGPPGQVPAFYATTTHIIPTGRSGNSMKGEIQSVGPSVVDCLKALKDQFDEIEKLRVVQEDIAPGRIVPVNANGRVKR